MANKAKDETDLKSHLLVHSRSLLRNSIRFGSDIYLFRSFLKEAYIDEGGVKYLLGILIKDIGLKKRFRSFDCLKVLKFQVKGRVFKRSDIVDDLFFVFQYYIFHKNKNVRSLVNILIKDRVLTDKQIRWLIENFQESDHIFNRLVRYPIRNDLIRKWAEDTYRSNRYPERSSELISWFVSEKFSEIIVSVQPSNIVWAIYFSKLDKKDKERLLSQVLQIKWREIAFEVLKVSRRIGSKNIIKEVTRYVLDGD